MPDELHELAIAIARLDGKLDALIQGNSLRFVDFERRLQESLEDRRAIRSDIERRQHEAETEHDTLSNRIGGLEVWRAWSTGIGAGVGMVLGLLTTYATLHAAGVQF